MKRLFRHMAMIMAWAGTMLLTGCQYADMVSNLRDAERDTDSLVIGFYNGVISNPVSTRAVSLLSEHLNTMGVWGWQTTSQGEVECLFLNKEVTFNPSLAKWTYMPPKYWESKSKYRFYAYAPHSDTNPANVSIDPETGHISITGVTLTGSNTVNAPDTVTLGNFSHVSDIDWMIDRTGQHLDGTYRSDVSFNMQHILSKLCVKANIGANFVAQDDQEQFIRVDSMRIGSFICQGNFTQKLSQSPSPRDTTQLNYRKAEWEPIDTLPRYSIIGATGVDVTDSCAYIIESLIIPQRTDATQMIDIWYSIGVDGGFVNRFHYVIPLSDVFSGFVAGANYIIDVMISPEAITFDSGVAGWEDFMNPDFNVNYQ